MEPISIAAVDINRDGLVDLVTANDGGNTVTVLTNTPVFAFTGNDSGLTSLNASQLTSGTVPLARLPGTVVTNTETAVTLNVTFSGNGSVGIGTTAPDSTLTVNGSVDKPGGGSWATYSDARLKDISAPYHRASQVGLAVPLGRRSQAKAAARPLVLSAGRVRANCFLLSSTQA